MTALLHATAPQSAILSDADLIGEMARSIGAALPADCVILFGSRARGDCHDRSDVDLAVIAGQGELNKEQRYELRQRALQQAETTAAGRYRNVDIIVWTDDEFRIKKRSLNHVAGRAWREGLVLYGKHRNRPGEEIVSELDNARLLMRQCREQLKGVNNMLDDEIFPEGIFGFHAQRAAELALKAWVGLVGQRYERTHHVAELVAILNAAGAAAVNRYAHLSTLTPYAVKYIYEGIENPTMDRKYIASEVNELADLVAGLLHQAERADGGDNAVV